LQGIDRKAYTLLVIQGILMGNYGYVILGLCALTHLILNWGFMLYLGLGWTQSDL
jgi:hypothetical protein